MSITLKPTGDAIIVVRQEIEKPPETGLVNPNAVQEPPNTGHVIAVGNGVLTPTGERFAPDFEEGDRVIFSNFVGTETKIEGKTVLILKETDIFAKIIGN